MNTFDWSQYRPGLTGLLPQLRERRRSGKRLTKPLRLLDGLRHDLAEHYRESRKCALGKYCRPGCVKKSHRQYEYAPEPPDVEMLRGGEWQPVGQRQHYGHGLTWKMLREEGAFA